MEFLYPEVAQREQELHDLLQKFRKTSFREYVCVPSTLDIAVVTPVFSLPAFLLPAHSVALWTVATSCSETGLYWEGAVGKQSSVLTHFCHS